MPAVAIVGASRDRSKFGNIALRAYAENGYDVYPVNPKESEIEGHTAYASVADIPVYLDRVSIYLPPDRAMAMLEELGDTHVGEIFLNPGSDTPAVLEKAHDLGLNAVCECSIADLGLSPSEYAAK